VTIIFASQCYFLVHTKSVDSDFARSAIFLMTVV